MSAISNTRRYTSEKLRSHSPASKILNSNLWGRENSEKSRRLTSQLRLTGPTEVPKVGD